MSMDVESKVCMVWKKDVNTKNMSMDVERKLGEGMLSNGPPPNLRVVGPQIREEGPLK